MLLCKSTGYHKAVYVNSASLSWTNLRCIHLRSAHHANTTSKFWASFSQNVIIKGWHCSKDPWQVWSELIAGVATCSLWESATPCDMTKKALPMKTFTLSNVPRNVLNAHIAQSFMWQYENSLMCKKGTWIIPQINITKSRIMVKLSFDEELEVRRKLWEEYQTYFYLFNEHSFG